ncbi:MAG: hypothetical protein ACE5HP_01475 [Gemmatimonadota bacterium]
MSYLVAGYGLTWGVLAWYAWRLERRSRRAGRALAAGSTRGPGAGPAAESREEGSGA